MTRPSTAAVEFRGSESKSSRSDSVGFTDWVAKLSSSTVFSDVLLLSSMPRGGWHVIQPARVREELFENYLKLGQRSDAVSLQAVLRGKAVRGSELPGFDASNFARTFLTPSGLRFVAAAPIGDPVIRGFPGVVCVYRNASQGDFSDADLRALSQAASELSAEIERVRSKRVAALNGAVPKTERLPGSIFAFDPAGKSLLGTDALDSIDSVLKQNILQEAKRRGQLDLAKARGADRVSLPDSRGNLVPFRAVVFESYPALRSGPVVFLCAQPTCCDWALVRASDVGADVELSRLIPAIRFMQQNYSRGPTLIEISRQVQLSPFHFHRRFTELLGITPKHVMLDCQIADAKRMLLGREKSLAQIAKDCGFAHQSHFTSRFKQSAGLTPTRWRRVMAEPK